MGSSKKRNAWVNIYNPGRKFDSFLKGQTKEILKLMKTRRYLVSYGEKAVKISPSKLISLLFFVFSGYYLYTAYQIQVFAFDENAPFNAKTFPIYLGFAGLVFSALYIIFAGQIQQT